MKKFLFFCILCFVYLAIFAKPMSQNFDEKNAQQKTPQSETEASKVKEFFTLKDKLSDEFENKFWTEDESIKTQVLAMPYNLSDTPKNLTWLYAQINDSNAIAPELTDLGTLNYFGIPHDLLAYCEQLSENIKTKKIASESISGARQFLQYFFPIVLSEVPNIKSIFYARPEMQEDGAKIDFRLNFTQNKNGLKYALARAVAIYENDKWTLYEFELMETKYEKFE